MPEGDTVHKLAAALGPALAGRTLAAVWAQGRDWRHLERLRVDSVGSRGKHLLIDLGGRWTLRSHLGLHGTWHCYRPGSRWQRPRDQASLVLTLSERVYVLFNAKELELLAVDGFHRGDALRRLGPDLVDEDPDPRQLWSRAHTLLDPKTPVVDLLLDQRVASGIGNVYKSEVLFLAGRSPMLRLVDLEIDDLFALYRIASYWLRRNLGAGPRTTREATDGRGPLWVYRRAGLPCLRCGSEVQRRRLGRNPRSTYWCPTCQAERGRR